MDLKQEDLQYCKKIFKQHSSSYYFATKFFNKRIREATIVLYSFFRLPDEIVDNPDYEDEKKIREELKDFKQKWKQAYASGTSDRAVLRATQAVFKKYDIPYEYSESFLKAMIQDTRKKRYKTFDELEKYMYGSAGVVGLMMSYVIGFTDKQALEYAKKLGYAMQMSNFLRDIQEDYVKRDRIYLPQNDLDRFNVAEKDIENEIVNQNFKDLIKFEIKRTRKLYKQSKRGIPMLKKEGRYPVKLALVLYRKYLDKIESKNYDVYNSNISLSIWDKLTSLLIAMRI